MEDKMFKVSELIEAENINDEDIIMIVQNGINKKIKAEKVGSGTENGESSIVVEDTLESDSITNALSANQGKELNEKIKNMGIYSTEEIDTEKTWIDGNKIYRKIYIVNNVLVNTMRNISIDEINYNTVIKLSGFLSSNEYPHVPIPYLYDGNANSCFIQNDKIFFQLAFNANTVYMFLEYTKTTD